MLLFILHMILLLTIKIESLGVTKRYEYAVPGEGVVVEQKDSVNCSIVIIATDSLVIYGSLAPANRNDSAAKKSFVYEGDGKKGKLLGTLDTLDSNGLPIITNFSTVTIFSTSLTNGGFMVRLYSDISDMNYSFACFSNDQQSRKVSLKGVRKRPAAVTILDNSYSEISDYLYLDAMNLSSKATLYWNAETRLLMNTNVVSFYYTMSPFNCRQSVPGKVNTFVVVEGTVSLQFIWWNTSYEKEVFVKNDRFFLRTSTYGNVSAPGTILNPTVPMPFPAKVTFFGCGNFSISYFADGQPQLTVIDGAQAALLFGHKFQVQYLNYSNSTKDGKIPGQIQIGVQSQNRCNFLGIEQYYTCTEEFYLTDKIEEAIADCAEINGSLPIFHDYDDVSILQKSLEFSFLQPYGTDSNLKVWLGFSNGKWLDGSNFTADGLNYTGSLNPQTSLVYDRQTKQIIEWTGAAGMICTYNTNSNGVCKSFSMEDLYYFAPFSLCLNMTFSSNFKQVSTDCTSFVPKSANVPEPQSYKENELIYNFAKTVKYTAGGSADLQDMGKYVYLNYQGGDGQKCNIWPNSQQPMNYTNFVDSFNYTNCVNDQMCLAMRLVFPEAGKWNLMPCATDLIGICALKN